MIIEEEIYLEHFGKKGMKWGQRTSASSSSNSSGKKKMSTNKKVAIGVAVTATAAVGLAFMVKHMKGKTVISSLNNAKVQHGKEYVSYINKLEKQRQTADNLKIHANKLRLEGKADTIMERRKETGAAYKEYLRKRGINP